jgi:hypothetical protein
MESLSEPILWKLPVEVAGSIITEYLTLRNISGLDAACCANTERTLYFEALRNGGQLSEVVAEDNAIDWVVKRNVRVSKLTVRSEKSLACLTAVVASSQLFATIELQAALWVREPSVFQNVILLLSTVEQKVSFLSVRCLPNGTSFPGDVMFSNLLALTAECCSESSRQVADMINRNPLLKAVKITAREPLPASVFTALLARRSALVNLTFLVTDTLTNTLFKQITAYCPDIRSLEMGDVGAGNTIELISHGLICLAGGCQALRVLTIFSSLVLGEAAHQAVLRGLKNLCVLNVVRAGMELNDAHLLTLAECRSHAPFLTELEITWNVQQTNTVARSAVVLANLRRLVLCTAHLLQPVDALQAGLAQLAQLEDLTLRVPRASISNLVSAVARGSPNLRSISVSCAWQDSAEAGLIEVAQHCPLLEKVQTYGGEISDRVLQALARHCSRFRALSESRARCEVTTAGLLTLVQGCPLLTTLDIQVSALNDTVLQALAQHSYYLEKLRIPRAFDVSEEAVLQLVASCKHLNTLWVRGYADLRQRLEHFSRLRGRTLSAVYYY